MKETWLHGTRKSDEILQSGMKVITELKKRTDPGDFGTGIYFTKNVARAAYHGSGRIFRCEIDMTNVAELENPYRAFDEPKPDHASQLFRKLAFDTEGFVLMAIELQEDVFEKRTPGLMLTVSSYFPVEWRHSFAQRIREGFLQNGYTGLVGRNISGLEDFQEELVVFDPKIIKNCELVMLKPYFEREDV